MTDLPNDHDDAGQEPTPSGPTPTEPTPTEPTPTAPTGSVPPTPPQQQWPQQQSGMSGAEQRNWGVGAHLSAFVASVFTGLAVLGPLVVYLIKKDDDPFVREHSREALNFQLTWLIGGFVATVLAIIVAIVTVGLGLIVLIPAAIGFFIAWIVFVVKGAMAASRGEYYRYPLTIRMVS